MKILKARVPSEYYDIIHNISKKTGIPKSHILTMILATHFEKEPQPFQITMLIKEEIE